MISSGRKVCSVSCRAVPRSLRNGSTFIISLVRYTGICQALCWAEAIGLCSGEVSGLNTAGIFTVGN